MAKASGVRRSVRSGLGALAARLRVWEVTCLILGIAFLSNFCGHSSIRGSKAGLLFAI